MIPRNTVQKSPKVPILRLFPLGEGGGEPRRAGASSWFLVKSFKSNRKVVESGRRPVSSGLEDVKKPVNPLSVGFVRFSRSQKKFTVGGEKSPSCFLSLGQGGGRNNQSRRQSPG
jgi:hypothetical protein